MPKKANLTGRVFGRLTVAGEAVGASRRSWDCRCECGSVTVVPTSHLTTGHTSSCGCLFSERVRVMNKTHGQSYTSTWNAWSGAKGRCHNPRNQRFNYYGARGIQMCERWRDSFQAFLDDMGSKPSPSHSLDRIDNARGYEPGNCRWATRIDQARNRRNTRWMTMDGRTLPMAHWAKELGVARRNLSAMLKRGHTLESIKALRSARRSHGPALN